MIVAIVHDEVDEASPADARDAIVQAEAVAGALAELGHESVRRSVGLDLAVARRTIQNTRAHFVFNLVESLGGQGRYIHIIPSMLDGMGMMYTGAKADAIYQTSNKLAAKRLMRFAKIPTPAWIECGMSDSEATAVADGEPSPDRWIIKSVWEHASIGLDDGAIIAGASARDVRGAIMARRGALGGEAFAEAYIDGREFNLSILAGEHGPEVLRPAEIDFRAFPAGQARIVGYRAKWEAGSFEYENTPRRFDFPPTDALLLATLRDVALRCWRLFNLRGHARVDFRVDESGRPWVLEVNANPCLSPDAGFAAAIAQTGIKFSTAIDRIMRDALRGHDA